MIAFILLVGYPPFAHQDDEDDSFVEAILKGESPPGRARCEDRDLWA